MSLFRLLFLHLLPLTYSLKLNFITPDESHEIIVFSEADTKGRWRYRAARLASGYYFATYELESGPYSQRPNHVRLSSLVAPARDLSPYQPTTAIPSLTEVLFTDDEGCKGDSCVFRRGQVVREITTNSYYEIDATVCRSIGVAAGRRDRLVSRTAFESETARRHVTQIRPFRKDDEATWHRRICREKQYADQLGTYNIIIRSETTASTGCDQYKIARVSLAPKIKSTIDGGEPEFKIVPKETNEIVLDSGNDIEQLDIEYGRSVLVRDLRDRNTWWKGTIGAVSQNIQVNLTQTHESLVNPYYVAMKDVRDDLRPLRYLVAPLCRASTASTSTVTTSTVTTDKEILTTTTSVTKEPFIVIDDISKTPSKNHIAIIVIVALTILCVVVVIGLAYMIVKIRRNKRERERNRKTLLTRQKSHGVRDTLNVNLNQSMDFAQPAADQEPIHYDTPRVVKRETNLDTSAETDSLYTEVILNDTGAYANVDLMSHFLDKDREDVYNKLKRNDASTIKSSHLIDNNYDKPIKEDPEPVYFDYDDAAANPNYYAEPQRAQNPLTR